MTIVEQVAALTNYETGAAIAAALAFGVLPFRLIAWGARKMLEALG